MDILVEELTEIAQVVIDEDLRELLVFNDDFNTFDHVIETLIRVCKHEVTQAEQCAHIIHFKGKCCVKKGKLSVLKPMKEAICEVGIKAAIL